MTGVCHPTTLRKPPIIWCLLGAIITLTFAAQADPWSFAVAGDDRTDPANSPDPTGINTAVFTNLLHVISARKPRFMLFTGDLVVGNNRGVAAKVEAQLKNWQAIVHATAPDLLILPVRGNHETKGDADGKIWLKLFKPGLDAAGVNYLPGEEGFSYTYSPPDHPEAEVIALDQFLPHHVHRVNLTQLDNALKSARDHKTAHVFVFAHEMAFTCGSHGDDENMGASPRQRDQFVNLLAGYGCDYFLAGHDHAYDWMVIQHPEWPAGRVLNQIVAGTAGAPFYDDNGYWGDHHGYNLARKEHAQDTHGYVWVTVDDSPFSNKVTCAFVPVKF